MASIYRHGKRWRASIVLPNGRRRTKVFDLKADADAWARSLETDADRGQWTDPAAGRRPFAEYAATWIRSQRWRPTTREQAESHLRRWILPSFGDRPIGSITNTQVRAWVGELEHARKPGSDEPALSPATIEALYRRLVSIFEAAVADRVVAINPATVKRITLPERRPRDPGELVVLGTDHVLALADAVPDRLRAFVWCGAAAGLRPGESAGLTIEALDLPRRQLTVDRQLSTSAGGPRLAEPKTPASRRIVPIPDELVTELARHLEHHDPVEIDDRAGSRRLIFSNRDGRPLRRNALSDAWTRAARKADLPPPARGWHQLRHFYASALIAAGESVKTVQARLGHATAAETLNTYAALWPDAAESTRSAISAAFDSYGRAAPRGTA